MTVRHAIADLAHEGVIVTKQGKGTYVAHQKMDMQLRITSFGQEMRMRGMVPSSRVLQARRVDVSGFTAAALALDEGEQAWHLQRLRSANGSPMCMEEAWLPAGILPGFLEPAPPESLYTELAERGLEPTWGEDTIEAICMPAALAEHLQVDEGVAGIKVTRRTFAQQVPVGLSISVYRGDKYKLWVPISQPATPFHPGADQNMNTLRGQNG